MKIRIIGCSGSGKTHLAKKLSEKYNIPHFDLDDIQWDNTAESYGTKMPVEKRAALLENILTKPHWIIEGVYYKWCRQSFEDADIIYVLDIPEYLYRYRIFSRFVKRKMGVQKGKKETLSYLCNLLKWTKKFQNENMKEIKLLMNEYSDKTFWLSSKKEINMQLK